MSRSDPYKASLDREKANVLCKTAVNKRGVRRARVKPNV